MSRQDENTPTMIGEYRIERRIGAGGMGVVHLAVSPSGRRVALKVIREEFAEDPDYRVRFRHEIEAARQVSGAFTAPVVGADPDADPPWMATQYFDAPTLSQRVRETGAFDEDAVWRLGQGLAEALRDIHRAGLVHRDLKPSNVLLTEDGPRVIDFGIARVLDAEPLTRTGKLLGTVSFMAPEQLSTPREVGTAADLFALGGVLTYAATGRGPYDGNSGAPPIAIAMKITHDDPDLTGVPPALRAIVEPCLRKDPATRPTPTELLTLLRVKTVPANSSEDPGEVTGQERAAESATAAVPGPVDGTAEPVVTMEPAGLPNGPRRRTYLLTAVALIAAVTAVVVPVLQSGGRGDGDANGSASPGASVSAPQGAATAEPVAALRPKGWALWEKKPTAAAEDLAGELPSCTGVADVLACTEVGVVAERIDVDTGRVMWSVAHTTPNARPGSIVGVTEETVLVQDVERQLLVGLDVKTGDRLWSVPAAEPPDFVVEEATFMTVHPHVDGTRIDRRDILTGKLVETRTFPSGEYVELFVGGDSEFPTLHLMKYGEEGTITSVAYVGDDLTDTHVLATFDRDPGVPVAADNGAVSFLGDRAVTRVTEQDGSVERISLPDAPVSFTVRVQADIAYLSRADGTLVAYDLRSGRRLWTVRTGGESPARPVLDDGRVYSLSGNGQITCLDAATGRIVWRSAARRDPNRPVAGVVDVHPEPVLLNGVAYAGTTAGAIFAVTPP